MKRTIAFLLTVTLLIGMLAISCGAVEAKPSGQTLYVDGKPVSCASYDVEGTTYFKLRDLAVLFKDTPAEFSVNWDEATQTVVLESSKKYTPVGGELTAAADPGANVTAGTHALRIDGRDVTNINSYNINGCNYFPLHRLSIWLYFETDFDSDRNRIGVITMQLTGCELPDADFYGTAADRTAAAQNPVEDR